MKYSYLRRPLGLALTAALLAGCTYGLPPAPTPAPFLLPQAAPAAAVAGASAGRQVYTVQRGDVRDKLTFTAEVALDKRENLYFGAGGRIQEVYVQSGDKVQLDQVIAVLDTRTLELDRDAAAVTLDLAQQRLALAEAELRFDTLQRELDLQAARLRLARLNADAKATKTDRTLQELLVRAAEIELQQLESGVEPGFQADVTRSDIALRKIDIALADAQITAPFAGQILLYDELEPGNTVAAYAPVAAIVDPNTLVLQANLVPADLKALHEGMVVEIAPSDSLAQPLQGVVRTLPQPFGTGAGPTTVIVPLSAPRSGNTAVNSTVAYAASTGLPAAGLLRPGATVEITALRAESDGALWLPPDAIQGYKDSYFVRLPDGSEQPVTVGLFTADRVEITAGLTFGQVILGK